MGPVVSCFFENFLLLLLHFFSGADVNLAEKTSGRTALFVASVRGFVDIVRALLAAGVSPSQFFKN